MGRPRDREYFEPELRLIRRMVESGFFDVARGLTEAWEHFMLLEPNKDNHTTISVFEYRLSIAVAEGSLFRVRHGNGRRGTGWISAEAFSAPSAGAPDEVLDSASATPTGKDIYPMRRDLMMAHAKQFLEDACDAMSRHHPRYALRLVGKAQGVIFIMLNCDAFNYRQDLVTISRVADDLQAQLEHRLTEIDPKTLISDEQQSV